MIADDCVLSLHTKVLGQWGIFHWMPVEQTPTLTEAPVAGKNTDSVARGKGDGLALYEDRKCYWVNMLKMTMMMLKMSVELRKVSSVKVTKSQKHSWTQH